MKDFLKDKTWEDWLIYSIGVIILFGLLLFAIGYLWKFEPTVSVFGESKNVRQFVSDSDGLNLFQYVTTIPPMMTTLHSMTILAIVGFSFIMLGLSSIVALIVFVMVYEWVWPVIKEKLSKNK